MTRCTHTAGVCDRLVCDRQASRAVTRAASYGDLDGTTAAVMARTGKLRTASDDFVRRGNMLSESDRAEYKAAWTKAFRAAGGAL